MTQSARLRPKLLIASRSCRPPRPWAVARPASGPARRPAPWLQGSRPRRRRATAITHGTDLPVREGAPVPHHHPNIGCRRPLRIPNHRQADSQAAPAGGPRRAGHDRQVQASPRRQDSADAARASSVPPSRSAGSVHSTAAGSAECRRSPAAAAPSAPSVAGRAGGAASRRGGTDRPTTRPGPAPGPAGPAPPPRAPAAVRDRAGRPPAAARPARVAGPRSGGQPRDRRGDGGYARARDRLQQRRQALPGDRPRREQRVALRMQRWRAAPGSRRRPARARCVARPPPPPRRPALRSPRHRRPDRRAPGAAGPAAPRVRGWTGPPPRSRPPRCKRGAQPAGRHASAAAAAGGPGSVSRSAAMPASPAGPLPAAPAHQHASPPGRRHGGRAADARCPPRGTPRPAPRSGPAAPARPAPARPAGRAAASACGECPRAASRSRVSAASARRPRPQSVVDDQRQHRPAARRRPAARPAAPAPCCRRPPRPRRPGAAPPRTAPAAPSARRTPRRRPAVSRHGAGQRHPARCRSAAARLRALAARCGRELGAQLVERRAGRRLVADRGQRVGQPEQRFLARAARCGTACRCRRRPAPPAGSCAGRPAPGPAGTGRRWRAAMRPPGQHLARRRLGRRHSRAGPAPRSPAADAISGVRGAGRGAARRRRAAASDAPRLWAAGSGPRAGAAAALLPAAGGARGRRRAAGAGRPPPCLQPEVQVADLLGQFVALPLDLVGELRRRGRAARAPAPPAPAPGRAAAPACRCPRGGPAGGPAAGRDSAAEQDPPAAATPASRPTWACSTCMIVPQLQDLVLQRDRLAAVHLRRAGTADRPAPAPASNTSCQPTAISCGTLLDPVQAR